MRVGIEVGGTFTDLIATDGASVRIAKVPSVPSHPEIGVLAALEAASIPVSAISDLVHGSTVATNAVLERKGGRVAFITTAGFTDLLLIQRQERSNIYQLVYSKPAAIVGRADTFGLSERVLADGSIAGALNVEAIAEELLAFLSRQDYVAVAICLLNAYANPVHERAVAELIRARLPALHVTCSHEISREFREYERASTTALSAYVQPVIDSYLGRLERSLEQGGFKGRFSVMQSNGGRLPATAMRRDAITALFSGPAAGVTGAIQQARLSGYDHLITLDMGGTSTDVSLISNGKPGLAPETMIDGLPVRTPVIDIATVGAGGGSIIWCDAGGMLRVGPHSAGADPGPACYGRGGRLPTITDAHAIRGTLPSDVRLGGHMRIDVAAARAAFQDLAKTFSMSIEQLADSAVRIADANVGRALQLISTEKGLDPRDYVLVPFGGAGPLHAARIAEDLGLTKIVLPRNAGVLSAFGLLVSDFKQFETLTRRIMVDDAAPDIVRTTFGEMRDGLQRRVRAHGLAGEPRFSSILQMRFSGQAFELDVPLSQDSLPTLTSAELRRLFEEAHHRAYFHTGKDMTGKGVEIVGFHLGAQLPAAQAIDLPPPVTDPQPLRQLSVHEGGQTRPCALLSFAHLADGTVHEGPALICDETSTAYAPPGWRISGDAAGNIVLQRQVD